MTTRRGFMGLAAALGLGGPEVAKDAISGNVGISKSPQQPYNAYGDFIGESVAEKVKLPRAAQIALIKANPHLMKALIEQIKTHQIPDLNYATLDPDLESYKSFSKAAKHRIQYERNLKRAVERHLTPIERNWYWKVLEKAGIDL